MKFTSGCRVVLHLQGTISIFVVWIALRKQNKEYTIKNTILNTFVDVLVKPDDDTKLIHASLNHEI